jgi:filamentous hemagglutinin family protein
MNKFFKVIWSKVHRQFIAVGEIARSAKKQNNSRDRVKLAAKTAAATLFTSGVLLSHSLMADPISANALPTNPEVISGAADFQAIENQLTIQQNTNQLITNWDTFNIGSDASVNFIQPDSSSSALNFVQSMDPSYIFGSLTANGQVILVNPSGIQFGPGARFDGSSFIGSTLNIDGQDYLNGNLDFYNQGKAQSILNEGSLSAFANGTVALIAPQITNLGTITSPSGSTALLSGDRINLALNGNKLIRYSVDQGTLNSLIENKGAIQATRRCCHIVSQRRE